MRIISKILVVFMIVSNILTVLPSFQLKVSAVTIKDSTEEIIIYRNTSRSQGEDNKGFNIPFHTNEPLGIEVNKATEIEVMIEGSDISGSGRLNYHDVNNLRYAGSVPVNEWTTINVPAMSQLFLEVGGVKYTPDYNTNFKFNVKFRLNSEDYKVSPIYDARTNKISNKTLSAVQFKTEVFKAENALSGSLILTDNARIYIPQNKYIRTWFDVDATVRLHENTINKYNQYIGLNESNSKDINKPRRNFVLVSARNEQIGYMSAGGTMLDTRPSNISEYLDGGNTDKWGHYHEYAHLYEQGWGYIEYWNNMLANEISREKFGPNWAWIYGNSPENMENKMVGMFDNYFNNGTLGSIHPMYYFLKIREGLDPNYFSSVETFYRENKTYYGGAEYIAYHAAKTYGVNIIPYLRLAGEPMDNAQFIKEIMDLTSTSFVYVPDNPTLSAYKNMSIPVTTLPIYSSSNQVLKGMSNPNSEVFIKLDGTEYKVVADANGKFEFNVPGTLTMTSELSVASKDINKEKGSFLKVNIVNDANEINFKGYENNNFLKVKINKETNALEAISNGRVPNPYLNSRAYIKMEHFNRRGELIKSYQLSNSSNADLLAEELSKVVLRDGDFFKLYHAEQGRLIIDGLVKDAPIYFSTNANNIDLSNSYFYYLDGNLKYSNTLLDLGLNKDDLSDFIANAKTYTGTDYTKTTWNNLENALVNAEKVNNNSNLTINEYSKAALDLKVAIENLRKVNVITVNGYNNAEIVKISFDTENNQFKATSTGSTANAYVGRTYFTFKHYNKRNDLLGTYSFRGGENANAFAAALNDKSFRDDDYIIITHAEQSNRLRVSGYIKNLDTNIENGVGALNMNSSLFYLMDENFVYSTTPLDLPLNANDLGDFITVAENSTNGNFTQNSLNNLQEKLNIANDIKNQSNPSEYIVIDAINSLDVAIRELKVKNEIMFKGYNGQNHLTIRFDTENNKLLAQSNGLTVHPYQGNNIYTKVFHYRADGTLVNTYQVRANEKADAMAAAINNQPFLEGDYLKIWQLEADNRIVIKGYLENQPKDLSNGSYGVDFNNSYFYLAGDNLVYSTAPIDTFKAEDVNKDGSVNVTDLSITASSYNSKENEHKYLFNRDVDRNKIIDIFDLVKISKEL